MTGQEKLTIGELVLAVTDGPSTEQLAAGLKLASTMPDLKVIIGLSDVCVQGAGRYKETDDEGSSPPAEEG